jgi:hypothetical protein
MLEWNECGKKSRLRKPLRLKKHKKADCKTGRSQGSMVEENQRPDTANRNIRKCIAAILPCLST